MGGKLPIDRVREAQDAPKIYDEHRERFTRHEAARREAQDRVSGARPEVDEAENVPETGDANDITRDRDAGE